MLKNTRACRMLQERQTPRQNAESDINNLRWCQRPKCKYYYKKRRVRLRQKWKITTRPGKFAFLLCHGAHKKVISA